MFKSKAIKYFLFLVTIIALMFYGLLIGLNTLSNITFGTLITDPVISRLFTVSSYLGFIISAAILFLLVEYKK